ncbi:response regulator transcription factor [soil metagenome]
MAKVLLVEDDIATAEFVSAYLNNDHHLVEHVTDGRDGLEYALQSDYDLILLDWDLPGLDGDKLLKELRAKGKKTPVIMLTCKTHVDRKTDALDGGADDYLTKPFDLKELAARIRVQLRKSADQISNVIALRNITMQPEKLKATMDGADLDLLPKEFALLEFFMRNPDKVYNVEAIMHRVWATDTESTPGAFRTVLARLRKKLEMPEGEKPLIETVHSAGYRFNS